MAVRVAELERAHAAGGGRKLLRPAFRNRVHVPQPRIGTAYVTYYESQMLEPKRGRVAVRWIGCAQRLERIERHLLLAQPEDLALSLAGQIQQRHLVRRNRLWRPIGLHAEHVGVELREALQVGRHQTKPCDGLESRSGHVKLPAHCMWQGSCFGSTCSWTVISTAGCSPIVPERCPFLPSVFVQP